MNLFQLLYVYFDPAPHLKLSLFTYHLRKGVLIDTLAEPSRRFGLKPCFTAPYSPSSNGMAEAFVVTFKRNYIYVSDFYSADWVLENLEECFYDYNHHAPHSGVAMMVPVYQNSH